MPKSEMKLKDFVKILRSNDFTKFSEQVEAVMQETVDEEIKDLEDDDAEKTDEARGVRRGTRATRVKSASAAARKTRDAKK
ncbi:hypothetical protein PP940_gp003 [Rhizobium phage RL2RES]|uniref:Uncharacterized protein n=1 Tax=Rhizobium phage RL2RES TaxID=103371 RepID=A0A6B9J1L4_9CAUD|nr:hypothetical protein PP940_gp003 [Rhizobium phage RL2RES]QGZ14299.1 hypothetical protein RL2RES_003 [Rhizobium phage RL2RES]